MHGEFYNSSSNPISVIFNSTGNFTIYFKIRDDQGKWSGEVNQTIYISNLTVSDDIEIWYNDSTSVLNISGYILILIFATAILFTLVKKYYL